MTNNASLSVTDPNEAMSSDEAMTAYLDYLNECNSDRDDQMVAKYEDSDIVYFDNEA